MSRIAGFIAKGTVGSISGICKNMLQESMPLNNWTQRVIEASGCALGFTGTDTTRVFESEELSVVMDGNIYNASDWAKVSGAAALVAQLYLSIGFEETLKRLNGDFALALYDRRKEILWLGRDRVGVKPLYYVTTGNNFLFASRPKALRPAGVVLEPDPSFVARFAGGHYRIFDNNEQGSPFKRVNQLPAGSYLRLEAGKSIVFKYWSLQDGDSKNSVEELAHEYQELLIDAVAIRLKTSGYKGFTLSGGMDSSSVLSCAVKSSRSHQEALSSVYSDKTYDESEDIRGILVECVSRWHSVPINNPDVFSLVRKMVAAHDEPVATATWLSHFVLCEYASGQGMTQFFGGLGGDELNAGEYEHFFYFFADLIAAGQKDRLEHEVEKWVEYHDHPIYRKNMKVVKDYLTKGIDPKVPGCCFGDHKRMFGYAYALSEEYRLKLENSPIISNTPFKSYLKGRTYLDMTYETIPCCIRAEDRQGMAFGIEHVLPFFDHRLIEFMFRVPTTLKYKDGVTKYLLREAMKGIVPEVTRTRVKKTGWNAPAHLWFSGKAIDRLRDMASSALMRRWKIYDQKVLERIITEHQQIIASGDVRENHMMFLWQFVNLTTWLESLEQV